MGAVLINIGVMVCQVVWLGFYQKYGAVNLVLVESRVGS